MGGVPYIRGVGVPNSEKTQSFTQTSNTRGARSPKLRSGLWGAGRVAPSLTC